MSADTPDALTAEEVEAGARALFEHFHGPQSAEKYAGTYSWPPPEQHLPWWRDAARAVLAARVAAERERADAPTWDCVNFTEPVTCLSAGVSVTARCGRCRLRLTLAEETVRLAALGGEATP